MLPLHTRARIQGLHRKTIAKVMTEAEADVSFLEPERCLIWENPGKPRAQPSERKWAGRISAGELPGSPPYGVAVDRVETPGVVAPGDVIRLVPGHARVSVLYRRGANGNTLLATERCNSFCLMCSQPPREADDSWLVAEMLETIPLIDRDERQLGISGGEPTLLGDELLTILHRAREDLPGTELHVLSNGRRFADDMFARAVCSVRHPRLTWGIPLYSDCPEIHDYIVQSRMAWEETLSGLYSLARHGANIELRIVVQRPNVQRLGELASFIFRNLTFAKHIAFMGLEPIGFARTNYDNLWVDPVDCGDSLLDAVFFLANRGMNVSVYNFPRCVLPRALWPFARQSISDWKNIYLPLCQGCNERSRCCGLFRSIDRRWTSRALEPIAPIGAKVSALKLKEEIGQ